MKPSDVLIVIGALGVAAALAALLGDGWVSQAMLPLAAGGVAGFVGERIRTGGSGAAGNDSLAQAEGPAVTRKQAAVESPVYLVLLGISGLWTAASSGSPVYLRVLGGVFGAFCVVALAVDFVKERRRKRAAADL